MALGSRTAPSRVLFGPHVTNLAHGRALGEGHVAHYAERAAGGCGVIVTEVASVHDSDHPYERAPLASACGDGWAAIVAACRPALVIAGLGHAGGQGSSAYHGRALWGASSTPDPASGEVPAVMGPTEVEAVVAGFAASAALAVASGCDGVEVQAGQHALLRQWWSPLTGPGSSSLVVAVLEAVRSVVGAGLVGLRLAVDEGAPWAGITPDDGVGWAADLVDYLVPVRGSAFVSGRPDAHTPPGFLVSTCAAVRRAVPCPVVLAGSVVDPAAARAALTDGVADLVEMTRAQIADPALVARVRAGRAPRPCVLTNQECRVRDVRNPLVSCTVNPAAVRSKPVDGFRASHAPSLALGACNSAFSTRAGSADRVLVVGGGPAGLEGARALASAGHRVRLVDRADRLGGILPAVAALPGRARFAAWVDWIVDEIRDLDVAVDLGVEIRDPPADGAVLVATGAEPSPVLAALADPPDGPVVIDDPLGDGAAVALAEWLAARGRTTALVTPDPVAGHQLARSGDLVDANVRLQRVGVERVLEARIDAVRPGVVVVRDVDTGERRELPCASLVDAGSRRAAPVGDERPGLVRVGDAVAPRTVHEAVLEGRAAAAELTRWLRR